MKSGIYVALIIYISLTLFKPVLAAAEAAGPTTKPLIAVIPPDLPPYYFRDGNSGKPSGLAVDITNALVRHAGLQVEYRFAKAWEEVDQLVLTGKADFIPLRVINPDTEKEFLFSSVLDVAPINYIVRATDYKTKGIFPGCRIGVLKNSTAATKLKDRTDINVIPYETLQYLLMDLVTGQLDLVMTFSNTIMQLAHKTGIEKQIRVIEPPVIESRRAIALCPGNTTLKQQLDSAIKTFHGSPEYLKIFERWMGKPTPFWTTNRLITAFSLFVVILSLGMAWWRYHSIYAINKKLTASSEKLHIQARELELEIAERQQIEETLSEERNYLQTLFEHGGSGHVIVSSTRTILRVNHQFCEMLGYTENELIGQEAEILHLDRQHYEDWAPVFKEAGKGKTRSKSEYPLRNKDGSIVWCVLTGVKLLLKNDEPGVVWSVIDISERKNAEEKLKAEESRVRLLLNSVAEGIVLAQRE